MKAMRVAKQEVLAIYHSHPASAAIPSRTDLANNTWGEAVAHVIIGNVTTEPDVRGWWLGEQEYTECELG
jgi:proteasome lid subunit RPN8/RPN11